MNTDIPSCFKLEPLSSSKDTINPEHRCFFIRRRQNRELTVHFNVHFAPNRKSVDAGDLYFVFTDEVLRGKLGIFEGLKIDPESITVQGKSGAKRLLVIK